MTCTRIIQRIWMAIIVGVFFNVTIWADELKQTVAEINQIKEVYVGKQLPDGKTELVFELNQLLLYSNQKHYGCIFVNGKIVGIRKYNSKDYYIRGEVDLSGAEEVTAYCGVIRHPEKIDPHDHRSLWKAFVNSPHEPFKGKLADRPRWWLENPILLKKQKEIEKQNFRKLALTKFNEIKQIYIGKDLPNGKTEVVVELKDMHFESNQKNFGCVFINGRFLDIQEYNKEFSYVLGEVDLSGLFNIKAYSGVLSHSDKIDANNHKELWHAFTVSNYEPFSENRSYLPEWWQRNPIEIKKLGTGNSRKYFTVLKPNIPVAKYNKIKDIYLGGRLANGKTEVVFEFDNDYYFISGRNHYGCIFVNGRIVQIREYCKDQSYVRGEVNLSGIDEIIAHSGVIWDPTKVDPHNHGALWRAFTDSSHEPFRGKVKDRPTWWVHNPIQKKYAGVKREPDDSYKYVRRTLHGMDKTEAIAKLRDPKTGEKERFYLVWSLATSGYTKDSFELLAEIACDVNEEDGTRGYAGMGLSNMLSATMSEEYRESVLDNLRKQYMKERLNTPDSIIRTMISMGAAGFIQELEGEKLEGDGMEIEVLRALPCKQSAERLWAMCQNVQEVKNERDWTNRYHPASALMHIEDKRGIDVLLELVVLEKVVSGQPRSNLFREIAKFLGNSFGYNHYNYHSSLDEHIPRMVKWWKANRDSFEFSRVKRK